eukprot:Sro38_g023590.1 LRR receptor-like serine threonine-protein kinase (399) ;mRNA; r:23241-24437
MAVFYFATLGHTNWIHQGGGTVNVQTNLPDQSNGNQGGSTTEQQDISGYNINSEPWLSNNHLVCQWYSTAAVRNKEPCDKDGRFVYLSLMQNNLAGTLPEELAMMANTLDELELTRNYNIQGTIFTQIGHMQELWKVQLFKNSMTGTIPSQVGLLSKIKLFGLFENQFTGAIPREFWNLSSLRQVAVSRNQFTGTFLLDDLDGIQFPNLTDFKVASNRFTGTLPSTLGRFPKLKFIQFEKNQMTGELPTEIANLEHFSILDGRENQLVGTVPFVEYGRCKKMKRLMLSDNLLEGTLPSDMGSLVGLTHLDLATNLFEGSLPSELALLPKIKFLDLGQNVGITGTVPEDWNALNETLRRLDVRGTSISGTIPEGLCGMEEMAFDCSETLCGCGSKCPCN